MTHRTLVLGALLALSLALVLLSSGSAPPAAHALGDPTDEALKKFKEMEEAKFCNHFDDKFNEVTGDTAKDKIENMKGRIDLLFVIEGFFEKVIVSQRTDKANIELLKDLSGLITDLKGTVAAIPIAGVLMGPFFDFKPWPRDCRRQ